MFHQHKSDAIAQANKLRDDDRIESIAVQFEPYNGWVVQVVPKRVHLPEYEGVAELADGRKRPAPQKSGPKELASVATASGAGAPQAAIPAQLIATGDNTKIPASGICHEILAFFGEDPTSIEEALVAIQEVVVPKRKSALWESDPKAYLLDWVLWMHKKGALADGGRG